jgi:hypothetical protein
MSVMRAFPHTHGVLMRQLAAAGWDLRTRRHTALLLAIITMFAVRPFFGDTGAGAVLFSLAILLVVLVALLTIRADDLVGEREALRLQQRRRRPRRRARRRAIAGPRTRTDDRSWAADAESRTYGRRGGAGTVVDR